MKNLRLALAASFALIAVCASWSIFQHEQTLRHGQVVLLRLAPVDPRSLMQGDYVALRFSVDAGLPDRRDGQVPRYAYLELDEHQRGRLVGWGDELAPVPQHSMRIRTRDDRLSVGPNAFFFEEGHGEQFETAQWGEFRVSAAGQTLLTHLLDADLNRLAAQKR